MKYLILSVVVIVIIFAKPWELSFAGGVRQSADSTLLFTAPGTPSVIRILPLAQTISNEKSVLPETQRLDRMIERFMAQWEIQGVSFALMKDDKLLYTKGYGFADQENDIKTDVKHIFRIASASKLITAAGIMKLEEEGKLNLSDYVFGPNGILNDSIFANIKDPKIKTITVEHLLRHQGGFSSAYGDPMFCPLDIAEKMGVPAPVQLNTIIQFVISRCLRYTPGAGTMYSNIGYGILSRIIEKVSGTDYENYIRKHILQPAGCLDMHLGRNLYENKLENEVRYYESATKELIPACDGSNKIVPKYYGGNNIEELYGAGGWVASATEMLRFMAVIDGDSTIRDILKPETIQRMTDFSMNTSPIGWMHVNENGDWNRTGTLSGTSVLMKKQHDGYTWAFITNTSTWKGSKFPVYIDRMITKALSTVHDWPERDLFELQHFDQQKLLVLR